ncbi:hypothetical protein MTP99_019074 [Tenebrio molitor]|nr:hypothetical protein MTP99_019074 [Tenebrio molitor]CAH1377669.1 unnamed protein product [Tenebrio molitor]
MKFNMMKHAIVIFMSYTAMGLVLEAVDLGKIQTSEKSVIMAMYLDFVFLFIILVLTHKTKNYLTSMVLILTGNSFLLALVGTMMAQGFQITNPTTFLLFVFTVLFLYIGFENIYKDYLDNIINEEFSPVHNRFNYYD